MRHSLILMLLTGTVLFTSSARAQDSEFYKKPTTPAEYWRALNFEISVGKFDIAIGHLRGLLEINPTDPQLLEIEAKDGLVSFLRLRNVERWSRNKEADKEARANVEKLIQMVSTALKNELTNPARITRFAKNLSATPEEAAFALKELTRSGVDAIPVLVDLLRANQPATQRAAILEALPYFDVAVVPALVASLDAPEATLKLELLDALRKHPAYLTFSSRAETDLLPYLWRFVAPVERNPEALRRKARQMLFGLLDRDPVAERLQEQQLPQHRLVELARPFLDHKARFSSPDQVAVWKWENDRPAVTPTTISDAEEYFGLRYARWALEIQDDYAPAQKLFLTLALEKHFVRAGTDLPLSKSSPVLYGILATAPYGLLSDLTEQYLRESRPALAIAVLQTIGDRNESKAARPSEGAAAPNEFRPSLLLKAMDYPDRLVRFAAVEALLKAPGSPMHQRSSAIVKILAGFLQADEPDSGGKPKALLGDPDRVRGEMLAGVLRRAGFNVEVIKTGRDLVRRLQIKADVDLIVLDHHLPYPMFADTLAQVRADFRSADLPILVVASPDQPTTAHPITLVARLAALAAAEEHVDFLRSQRIVDEPRRAAAAHRFKLRSDAVRRHLEDAGIRVSSDVDDRIEYLVYLTTPVGELPVTLELEKTRLTLAQSDRFARMRALSAAPNRGHIAANESPFSDTRELTPALANVVARYEIGLSQEALDLARVYWQIMQSGQQEKDGRVLQDPLPGVAIRYPDIEARAKLLSQGVKRVRIIPEVFTEDALTEELQGFFKVQDPKQVEADKKGHAKAAIEWLRKMSLGELAGYPVIDAEGALRKALQNPEVAALAIDAVAQLPGKDVQQDIANVVLGPLEPSVRAQATDALIKHLQQRGAMISDPQRQLLLDKAAMETDPQLKNRLLALRGILQPSAKETGGRLIGFTPGPPMEPKEKKDEPKN